MATAVMEDVRQWQGLKVTDPQGNKIGEISDVYFDAETHRPEWGLVKGGFLGMHEHFVPLEQVRRIDEETIQVPYTQDKINDAPSVDADQELSQDEEQRLYSYYGMQYSRQASPTGYGQGGMQGQQAQQRGGQDTAMTRSEEEMRVGTVRRPSELVRLRKYVVTENVQQTVPVSHEEVRVEREPITEANREKAMTGPEIRENVHEETLYTEEPVVEKRVVPKERVRLEKEQETEEETVTGKVRKEEVEVERGKAGQNDPNRDPNRR